jgi:hypothetical protein
MPIHRSEQLQDRLTSHLRALLDDPRLRIDTRVGFKPANSFRQHVSLDSPADGSDGHPPGHILDIALLRQKWILLADVAARLYFRILGTPDAQDSAPLSAPLVARLLASISASAISPRVPTTVVIASVLPFTPDARELAERRAGRTVILVEPNGAGGFRVHGPNETRAISELFDPETEDEKRARLRAHVTARQSDLGAAGLSSEKLALATMLPETFVEAEIKSIVHDLPGWASRRLDGRIVLFRHDAASLASSSQGSPEPSSMRIGLSSSLASPPPAQIVERIGSLFTRKGENEKKITYISERRSALGQLRDRLYEELSAIEARETQLKTEYTSNALSSPIPTTPSSPAAPAAAPAAAAAGKSLGMAKRRIAAQLLRLRSESSRRQEQIVQLNAMIGVLGTHLQQLELARTGVTNELAEGSAIANDVARAEQLLAEFQPTPDLPSLLRKVPMLSAEISDEEAALLEELESFARSPADILNAPQSTPQPTLRLANGTHQRD